MKIAGAGPISSPPVRRKEQSGKSSATGFSEALGGQAPVAGAAGGGEITALSSVLSVQEVADFAGGNSRARRRGEDLLDRLEDLRLGLLSGTIAADGLDQILELVQRQRDSAVDPKLQEVLREIEVRASVELAKLGRLGR